MRVTRKRKCASSACRNRQRLRLNCQHGEIRARATSHHAPGPGDWRRRDRAHRVSARDRVFGPRPGLGRRAAAGASARRDRRLRREHTRPRRAGRRAARRLRCAGVADRSRRRRAHAAVLVAVGRLSKGFRLPDAGCSSGRRPTSSTRSGTSHERRALRDARRSSPTSAI